MLNYIKPKIRVLSDFLLLTVDHYRAAYFPQQRSLAVERAIAQMWDFDSFLGEIDFLRTLFREDELTGPGRPMGLFVGAELGSYRELLRYLTAILIQI